MASESNVNRRKRARVDNSAMYNHNAQPVISRTLGISADGRRVFNQPNQVAAPAPPESLPPPDWDPNETCEPIGESALYENGDNTIPDSSEDAVPAVGVKIRAARYTNSVSYDYTISFCLSSYASGQDFPLSTWIPLRNEFLDETMHLEGRADTADECARCSAAGATLRCEDCLGLQLLCSECCVLQHQYTPLHRIKVRHALLSP